MVFPFYRKLSRAQQKTYQQSDKIHTIPLPRAAWVEPLLRDLQEVLKLEDRRKTEAHCQELVAALMSILKVPPLRVEVLARRPSNDWGELHGLYTPPEKRKAAKVTIWMRTAQRRQVVAFRTFLRTLLHEVGHHLDYELLGLDETFHTEGFYKRESSLLYQLAGKPPQKDWGKGPKMPEIDKK